jgi:hypothetical protein
MIYFSCSNTMYEIFTRPINTLDCTNVILLHSNHQYFSTHSCGHLQCSEKMSTVTIIMFGLISTNYYCNRILVLTNLKMATWVAETCRRLLCNIMTFIQSSVFVFLIEIWLVPGVQHVALPVYRQHPAQNTDGLFNTHLRLFLSNQ